METNLAIDSNNIIRDHQSRIVEVNTWETYCRAYREYNGESIKFTSNSPGNTIQANCKITELVYDRVHLSCKVTNSRGFTDTRLAYVIF